jgi:hypothetical protein
MNLSAKQQRALRYPGGEFIGYDDAGRPAIEGPNGLGGTIRWAIAWNGEPDEIEGGVGDWTPEPDSIEEFEKPTPEPIKEPTTEPEEEVEPGLTEYQKGFVPEWLRKALAEKNKDAS